MSETRTHANGTPCWFDLMTPSPEGARQFYRQVFGWTFEVGGPETGGYTMCQLRKLNVAGLGQLPSGSNLPTAWHVYFATENIEQSAKAVAAAGGEITMGPMSVLSLGQLAMATDSCGAVFGLWQASAHTGAQVVDEPNASTWSEVNTRDRTQAARFYQDVFALVPRQLDAMDYSTLHHGEKAVCGVLQMTDEWGDMSSHWMIYFATDDADAASERVVAAGGRLCFPAFNTPKGRLAVVEDPMGAAFTLLQAK